MTTVRCTQSCYIDRYYEEGREYPFTGQDSPFLQAVDAAAETEAGALGEAAEQPEPSVRRKSR